MRHIPIVVEDVHDVTSLPNAEATGLGPSRRVVLWDTLVRDFTPREVTVVLAHELGHLAHNHIWKAVGWYALFAFPGLYLIARATRRKGGMANPQAVPLSLFVLVALTLAAQPLQNAISRHMEAEADWAALEATHDPAGATALFRGFVPTTLERAEPVELRVRAAREPPDDHAAHRDGAGVAHPETADRPCSTVPHLRARPLTPKETPCISHPDQADHVRASGAASGRCFLDGIVLGIVGGVLQADRRTNRSVDSSALALDIGYFGYFIGSPSGQTIGKRALGIRVIDAKTGGPIGFSRAVLRFFAAILSAIVFYLGYFWMLWDPEKQTWHDKIAGDVVVPVSAYPVESWPGHASDVGGARRCGERDTAGGGSRGRGNVGAEVGDARGRAAAEVRGAREAVGRLSS